MCSHIYRRHKDSASSSSGNSCTTATGAITVEESIPPIDLSLPDSLSHDVDILLHRDGVEQKKKSMLFLIRAKDAHSDCC
jgi:hypothetical protein